MAFQKYILNIGKFSKREGRRGKKGLSSGYYSHEISMQQKKYRKMNDRMKNRNILYMK